MDGVLRDRDAYVEGLGEFVTASPSSYHAAAETARLLEVAGFDRHWEEDAWAPLGSGSAGYVVRDGAVIAWRAGAGVGPLSPVRVLGAHTDSPGFVVKPQPDSTAEGWAQVGVEVYGGPLLNSWLDRDLEFAGRLVTAAGEEHLARTGASARIPQLAIHLDRDVNNGLTLDRQRHTQPILGIGDASVLTLLAEDAGVDAADVVGFDVCAVDTQRPARLGASDELFASGRLDNLSSVFAGLVALITTEPAEGSVAILAAFDHEEVGSETRSGAGGPFLEEVLTRLRSGLRSSQEDVLRALSASWCVSADAGHAVHPNYGERHDPGVRPRAGLGPMLKINANQRYTSDAHGAGMWRAACAAAGVATQEFVSNNTVPCGSTIGPITATRIGIRTVDVGVPLLSMHSARELAHVDDLHGLARAVSAFYLG